MASSTTHRETLIRALNRIRVDTTTSPEGLIHMLTVGRASCIVFSEDDLPPEGDHTRPLHISVGCLGRRIPSVLLDNGSALNVCPLAIAIALGYGPTDFEPSTQTVRAYDSTRREVMGTLTLELMIGPVVFQVLFQILRIPVSFNLLLGRPWIHSACAIPSSLHLKVKFIHDGQVITISSTGGAHLTSEPVLEISHGGDDLLMTGFAFDEIQTVEPGDFVRYSVPMSFDQHSSTVVLDMMRSMSYMLGLGLGRRQHGRSEFITVLDHDPPFGLGFVPVEADFRCMAQLRQERVRSRLHHIPFDYPLCPYSLRLTDYFVRASEPLSHPDGSIDEPTDIQHVELHQLFSQLQLRGGAPDTSTTLIAPPSPEQFSVLTMCFPDEIVDYGGIDGVMSSDDYDEELLRMVISQPEPNSALSDFHVLALRDDEDASLAPDDDAITGDVIVDIASPDILGHVVGESDAVDPPLSFDVLSGFLSRSDDVLAFSSMDLSIFVYSPVSFIDDIDACAPHSPTSQIHDIDDEPLRPDFDDSYLSDSDHSFTDERVSPPFDDLEIVDLGTADQPREMRIGTTLSADERDSLLRLLRSYLDVFAWSYEDMPGLDPSIVQHHLPLVPHARPVKQKLRRLHPRWSLQVKEEIQKQLSVGFISVVQYLEWLANVFPVPKKDGKVRVCVDFRNLNKASPKDDFPIPHIDMLVDSTAGHAMLTFMDGFSNYNQIMMAPEDREKTSFITEWGTYCYKVMPFGLKNTGATY